MLESYEIIEDIKKSALYIIRSMNFKTGQIIIDVNTSYNSATIKIKECHKKIKDGTEVLITETRIIK